MDDSRIDEQPRGSLCPRDSDLRVVARRVASHMRCRGFSVVERLTTSGGTNVVVDGIDISRKTEEIPRTTVGLETTTAIVIVTMAYVLWRVIMKRYSKVRLGIRNLPVSR